MMVCTHVSFSTTYTASGVWSCCWCCLFVLILILIFFVWDRWPKSQRQNVSRANTTRIVGITTHLHLTCDPLCRGSFGHPCQMVITPKDHRVNCKCVWTHHHSYRKICPLTHTYGHLVSSLLFGLATVAYSQSLKKTFKHIREFGKVL